MPRCLVHTTLQMDGTRYEPGSIVDLRDDHVAALPEGTVSVEADDVPTVPVTPEPPVVPGTGPDTVAQNVEVAAGEMDQVVDSSAQASDPVVGVATPVGETVAVAVATPKGKKK